MSDLFENALKGAEAHERKESLKASAEFGFSLSDLSTDSAKSAKNARATPKHRNPTEASQTWTGWGRKPKLVDDALKAGADISDLEI